MKKKKTKNKKKSRSKSRDKDKSRGGITSEGFFSKDEQLTLNNDLEIDSNLGSDMENE